MARLARSMANSLAFVSSAFCNLSTPLELRILKGDRAWESRGTYANAEQDRLEERIVADELLQDILLVRYVDQDGKCVFGDGLRWLSDSVERFWVGRTYFIVFHENLQVFDWSETRVLEDRWLSIRILNQILTGCASLASSFYIFEPCSTNAADLRIAVMQEFEKLEIVRGFVPGLLEFGITSSMSVGMA